jgi:hypothetical protein
VKAASTSRGGGVARQSVHRTESSRPVSATTTVAGPGLARRATEAADSSCSESSRSHSLFRPSTSEWPAPPTPTTQSQGNSEIHKFQRASWSMINLHGNPQWRFSLPFCASDMRRYPKKACGWTNNDRARTPPFRFCFGPSRLWEVQNIAVMSEQCFLRRCDIGQMCLWPAESRPR